MKGNVILTNESVSDFGHALKMLDSSLAELQRVANNMIPEILLRQGLKEALSDFCNESDKVNTMQIIFQFYGESFRIEANLEINAYRIILELMNNSIKHSGAKKLVVQMIQEADRLCFIVLDDGIGFNDKDITSAKGVGLATVKSVVGSFDGQFEIHSDPFQGSEITIEFMI